MVLVSVNCLIAGQASENAFPIPIGKDILVNNFNVSFDALTVSNFKEILFDRQYVKSATQDMVLYKVDLGLENLKNKIYTKDEIEGGIGAMMKPMRVFKDYFNNKDKVPVQNHLHIFIVVPPTGKRRAEYSDLGEENVSQNSKKEKLIDLSTPESIVEFLMEQEGLKTDFSKPHSLCANRYMFERKGREESFYKAYDFILKQYLDFQLDKKNSFDKLFFPFFAIQSAPGGGKSFFLDELAALKREDFDHFLQEKPDNRDAKHAMDELRNSVSICVTYNGNSTYKPNRDGDADEIGLVMRIIWSYFFDATKLSWDSFYNKFQIKFSLLDISEAIKSVIHHSGKSVLLCVDEIMKIDNKDHSNVINLLVDLYTPYHSLAYYNKKTEERGFRFRFIVSTLDAVCLNTFQTNSRRDINWIPLRRLKFSESIELFSKVTEKLGLDRKYIINKCISDCNGHPRTLEKFYELLSSNNTVLEFNNFTTLIEGLTKKISQWFGNNITFSVVKLALLGECVDLEYMVEVRNKHLSVKDLVASGIYINSVTKNANTTKVIPALTLVSLYYFCTKNKEDGDATTVAKILKDIFHTEDYFGFRSNDGKAFEEFHMSWESLYRALREDGMEVDLPEIYGLDDERVKIRIQRKNIVKLQRDIEFPPNSEIRDRKGNIINDLEKYIFVPTKSNNSDFEMVIFERKAGEGYIAINIECKYSWPDSETILGSEEIRNKYKNMKTKYLNHVKRKPPMTCVGKLGMTIDDIYLILVVWGDVSKLDRDIMINENIIIVEKKNLEKIYSPSLVSRPQFYSEIQKKIKN